VDFDRANIGLEAFLRERPGFLSRSLYRPAGGAQWIDLVHWADLEAARAAADEIGADPRCAAFLGCIEPGSATLTHAALSRTTGEPDRG
jgi:hypothetical protein